MSVTGETIAIVGAGAVGTVLAAHLVRAGHRVIVVQGGQRHEQIQDVGLAVRGRQDIAVRPPVLLTSVDELACHNEQIAICFVCTKTWSLAGMLPALKAALSQSTAVVSFQSGVGPEDDLLKFFPNDRVGRAVIAYGCAVEREGRVGMRAMREPNFLGGSNEELLRRYASLLSTAGLETEFLLAQELRSKVFFKTIIDSALNAVCASAGISMQQAMQYKHTRSLANLVVREGLSVAWAAGCHYDENARTRCMTWLEDGGDHLPTMALDLANNTRTEIEYVNGRFAKIGRQYKAVNVDVNLFFTSMIVSREIKSGARAKDDVPEYLLY